MRKSIFVLIIFASLLLLSSIVSAQFRFVPLDIISNFFNTILKSLGLTAATTTSQKTIPSSGSIVYEFPYPVLLNNKLSLGFQLDGYDITQWRTSTALQNLAKEAGFKMVRFFDKFSAYTPCLQWNVNTNTCSSWDWSEYNDLINDIRAIGAEPLPCLGYGGGGSVTIPKGMSRWSVDTFFPDPNSYAVYAAAWVANYKDKVKYWDIINEPYQSYFWTDSTKLSRYCQFWSTVAAAMRQVDDTILISHDGSTVKHALDYWIDNCGDLDFLDYHKYDSSSKNPANDDELFNRAESEWLTDYGGTSTNWRNYGIQEAKEVWGKDVPVICGESNLNWNYNPTDPRIQKMSGAVWTALTIRSNVLNGLDYMLYWNFAGKTNTENFGMVNKDNNQPYYPYYVMKWFGSNSEVDDPVVDITVSSDSNVRTLAWINNGKLNILLIHKSSQTRTINLQGVTGQFSYEKIDDPYDTKYDENPVPETGIINAGNTITFNGYTIMLLQKVYSTQ